MKKLIPVALTLTLTACGTADGGDGTDVGDSGANPNWCAEFDATAYPSVSEACELGVQNPTRLVITTTDFGSGALSVADVVNQTVSADVASANTDSVPFYHDDTVYVLNRFGFDSVDVLDAQNNMTLMSQHAIDAKDITSTNPQGLAFAPDGSAIVTTLGHSELQVFDFERASGEARTDLIELDRFADGDGNPEAGMAFSCGDITFVSVQRLQDFNRVDCDLLVPVDTTTGEAFDAPIPLLGAWAKQARPDLTDASGRTALILTTGIERVDVSTGTSAWAVDAALFAAEGLGSFNLLSFDITDDGTTAYVSSSTADYSEVQIWRAALDGSTGIEMVLGGLNAVEKTLEIVGDELWFGDTTLGQSGMRVYDISGVDPVEIAGPLSTGLPPYSVVAIP